MLAAIALASLTAACGPASEVDPLAGTQDLGFGKAALVADNGLSQNGLSQNGLSQNGLSQNGLSQNGFSQNGFTTWFNRSLPDSDAVMRYLYACAAPTGWTLTWTNPSTGTSYTWNGALGLAPEWVGGKPASVAEQQVITACLGAHVNKYGLSIPIALEGRAATGTKIPVGPNELTTFAQREAAVFGNLFTNEGIFLCADHGDFANKKAKSSVRACALDNGQPVGPSTICPPFYWTGDCTSFCQHNASMPFYDSCTYNGVTYQPLTTRFKKEHIHTCGDGICQVTERCGTGTTPDSCMADCGVCP
jgi:hypothetical protein